MNKQILKYYKSQMAGGKTTVAIGLDSVMFFAFSFIFLYFWTVYMFKSPLKAITVSFCIVGIVWILLMQIKGRRLEKFVTIENEKLKNKILLEKIMLMEEVNILSLAYDQQEFSCKQGCFFIDNKVIKLFQYHPTTKIDPNTILRLYRFCKKFGYKACTVITTGEFLKETENFCSKLDLDFELYNGEWLIKTIIDNGYLFLDTDLEMKIEEELILQKRKTVKNKWGFISRDKTKKYFVVGVFLFGISFLLKGFTWSYRIVGIGCFALCIISLVVNRYKEA